MVGPERITAYDFSASWNRGTALYVKWATGHGISYPTFRVLYALSKGRSMTQKEIVEYFGMTKQTVNTVIRQLNQDGYVSLKPGSRDHREKEVSLTDAGKKYADDLLAPLLAMEERVCANIHQERLAQMNETIELFNLLFEREMEREKRL